MSHMDIIRGNVIYYKPTRTRLKAKFAVVCCLFPT